MRSPNDVGERTLNELMDGDAKAAFEHMRATAASQHPMAKKLFADYRAGSKIMTSTEAYAIGNQLNAMLLENLELRQEMEAKFEIARETVEQLKAEIRELRGEAETPLPSADRETEEAIDDELARGAGK